MKNKKHKIIFTGGGTGGHIYPGVAVAQALQNIAPNVEVIFVGASRPLDKTILTKIGYPFYLLPIGPLNVGSLVLKIKTLLGIPWSFLCAFFLLLRLRPSFVIGFGGYASFPSLVAAKVLHIPYAVWEGNAHPGLVTRKMGAAARAIFLSFPEIGHESLKQKSLAYGVPTRFQASQMKQETTFRVLIFGGSSGARAINEVVYRFLKKVNENESGYEIFKNVEFVHQIGTTDFKKFEALYKGFQIDLDVREFIHNMPEELAKASFVICRAGASTVAEVALSQRAALFVPLPWAADNHQLMNAKRLSENSAALLKEQKDFTPESLGEILRDIIAHPEKRQAIETKVGTFAKPDSAEKIARKLLDYISYRSLL